MSSIRVLLAEDHQTVRHGLKLVIDAEPDMEVIGEAADGLVAVEAAKALQPDVVVLDISMPNQNGLAAARALKRVTPTVAVVVLTRHHDPAYVREMLTTGACGYVLKQSPTAELLRAVRAAAAGGTHLDPAIDTTHSPYARQSAGRPIISEREQEVLRLTAIGHSNKEVAALLGLSVKTIEVHKANAGRKLGLRGRIDFIRYAVLQGWLVDP
jgi:DNA-binding NarL/FixJ family response regulator